MKVSLEMFDRNQNFKLFILVVQTWKLACKDAVIKYKESRVYQDCQIRPSTPDFDQVEDLESANKLFEKWKDELADTLLQQSSAEPEIDQKKGIDFEQLANLETEDQVMRYIQIKSKDYINTLKSR